MEDAKSTKYYSQLQENRVGRYLNWGVVSGSGSRAGRPGDLSGAHFLGECKTHTEPGHKIVFNQQVWLKLCNEATSKYRFPVLIVDDGSQRLDRTWCLFPGFIVPDYTTVVDYAADITVNLIFDGVQASKLYSESFFGDEVEFGVFRVHFANQILAMCPLTEFGRIFGDT